MSRYVADAPADVAISELFERSFVARVDAALRRGNTAQAVAMMHVAWAASHRADRNKRGHPWIAVRYVADGAGVSPECARGAIRAACAMLGGARTPTGHVTIGADGLAACRRIVDRAIASGAFGPPAIHDDAKHDARGSGPALAVDLSRLHGTRGKVSCPCPVHARGDARPSLLVDTERHRATCMVDRSVWRLDDDGTIRLLRGSAQQPDDRQVGPNKYPEGRPVPTRRHNADRIPRATPGYDPGGSHASGNLRAYVARRGLVVSALTRTRSRHRSLGDALRWADVHRGGPRSEARAWAAVVADEARVAAGMQPAPLLVCPDLFWSLERLVPTEWTERVTRTRTWQEPTKWASLGSDLVLIDVDGMAHAPTTPDEAAVARVLAAVSKFDSRGIAGVASIVASSNEGVQVAIRMSGWRSPDMLAEFYASPSARSLLRDLGAAVAQALGRAGHVDESAWAVGRWARRPGWRVRRGTATRARLWFATTF